MPTARKARSTTATRHYQLYTNDQANHASDYKPLIVAYRNGAPVGAVGCRRRSSIRSQDLRNAGRANGKPAVLVILYRQPGANIIDDRRQCEARCCPELQGRAARQHRRHARFSTAPARSGPRCATPRQTLIIADRAGDAWWSSSSCAVSRATLIPAIAVPISLIGTLGPIYLLGYSLDNLSFMALIVATGFVVDDAIVVLENISRHHRGRHERAWMPPSWAPRRSAPPSSPSRISLIAVFLPILLMAGLVGPHLPRIRHHVVDLASSCRWSSR